MSSDRPILFGKYQLLSQIARGGMAEVWKAKAHGVEGFEKILVIKRILPDLSQNPRFVEMFINEAKIAVTLSHANIVQVFDLGHADGSYFIAMEHVAGMDLAATLKLLVKRQERLPPPLAVYIASELAKGLDYAHRRRDDTGKLLNIVHRDVSPQNVLLSFEGEVKLTDFGIAKARTLAQAVTELGVVKGKYTYMAPEQLVGGKLDARADVFATGILLYECLTGTNPFLADSTYDTLQRIRNGDVTPVQALVPEVDDEIVSVVERAMAFEPGDRYPTAGHLYEDLIQFLYSSAKRIGARDLSDQLRALRVGADEGGALSEGLRQAFEVEAIQSDLPPPPRPSSRQPDSGPAGEAGSDSEHTRVARRVTRDAPPVGTPHRQRTERRGVTAMMVDMASSEPLKTETMQGLAERFGGTLCVREDAPSERVQFAVLFGDQVPDGRDSDNAARCALRMARAATAAAADDGGSTTARIGIHAGGVLIDLEGGLVLDDDYEGLLSRAGELAASADTGHILVDSLTERELRSRFRLVPSGVAGSARQGHLLVSERNMTDGYGRFIGRRAVLGTIGSALAAANRGASQVIGLTGEAGSGKSRLLVETMRRLNLAGHAAGLYVATLTPQMREIPLSGVQEMLRVVMGVDEFDPESLLRDRTARLRELGLIEAEQTAIAMILGLHTESTDQPRERPLRTALVRIVRRLAVDRLTIFAWDGAEYLDNESTALIDDLLRSVSDARVAAILSYRPGTTFQWRELPTFTEIQVGPLADDEVARLTATRLGADEIPFELLREVTGKSAGNPLYVEEYLKALQEAGAVSFEDGQVLYEPDVAHVNVPKTLRGIIASRVARLKPGVRYLLQVAALAGERFNTRVVAAAAEDDASVVERALGSDEMRGIISSRGEKEHAFAHELVRQVVREGITLTARKEIHGALAAALTRLYPDREDEFAERLARHHEAADQPEQAVRYLAQAATRFEEEGSLDSAVAALQRAIELLASMDDEDPEQTFELYDRIADLSFRNRRLLEGAETLRRAIKRAETTKSNRWLARFCMWRGRLLAAASRVEEGRRWLDQAQHVARGLTDAALSRDVFVATADVDARSGEFERAVGFLLEALQLSEDQSDRDRLKCLLPLSLTYARMGDHETALKTLSEIQELADTVSSPRILCQVWRLESQIYYHARKQASSARAAAKAVEVAREAGLPYEAALNAHHLGEAYLRLGDHRRAFAALRNSFEVASERGYRRLQMSNLRALGYIDATRFASDEGRSRVARALNYAESHDFIWDIIQGKYFLAVIEQSRGDAQAARALVREVLTLAVQHGHRKYTEDAEEALGKLDEGVAIGLPE